ncbi:MAG: V-type ATP synthase subunit F [Eubacteriales bacterium]
MKMYLLSDNMDTWAGMRLCGIEGVVVHGKTEAEEQIKSLMQSGEYAVVLVTEKLRMMCADILDVAMLSCNQPLFLEIPDRHGFGRSKSSITDYIKKTIGLKM